MKRLFRGLVLVALVVVAAAIFAFTRGWLTVDMIRTKPTSTPSVAVLPSTPPRVIVAATPSPLPTRDPNVLRVAVDDRATSLLFLALPQYIENHRGDLKLRVTVVPNAAERWQLLAAGRVDIACGTLDSFVLASSRAPTGALLFKTARSAGLDVLVGRDVADIEALAHKRVAVVTGEGGAYLVGSFLNDHKMLPSEVVLVDVEDARDALGLLAGGRVQAAVLWQPYAQSALAIKGVRSLGDTSARPTLDEVCVANLNFLKTRPDDARRFMKFWFEQQAQLRANEAWGVEMIAQYVNRPAAEVAALLKNVQQIDLDQNKRLEPSGVGAEISTSQDFWRVLKAPNADQRIDVDQALRLDLVRDLDVATPTPIFGSTPKPSSAPSSTSTSSSAPPTIPTSEASAMPMPSPQPSEAVDTPADDSSARPAAEDSGAPETP